jgi:DNA-binding CsgD family transcriptional regulator
LQLDPDVSISCPFVIGRGEYLAAFDRVLEGASGGSGRVITIGGEAGIGKSRLVRELQERARTAESGPLNVMQGACFEHDDTLPYAPLLDLMRGCIVPKSAEEIQACLGEQAPEVLKLLPELAPRLPGVRPTQALDPEQEKRRAFDALSQMFVRLARERPLLMVFEDLHWSDDTSLEVLAYLARRAAQEPVLVMLTYRADEQTPALEHFLAGLDRARLVAEWPLARLTREQIAEMVTAIFQLERGPRAEFIEPLHELTEGNPFFIEEVLKSLVASGGIFFADGGWDRKPIAELRIPRSVQDAVRQRTTALSDDAQQLLLLAAVAGRRFDFELLANVSGRSEDELLSLIKELMAAQLVVEESPEQFAYRHALTQQAVYSGLLGRERRAMHLRVAEAMRELRGDEDVNAAALANHFFEAGAWEPAHEFACLAGERAQRLYAPREAAMQFTRAIEAARNAQIILPASLLCARGAAHESIGDFERARDDYEAGLDAARTGGAATAEWQALISLGALWASRDYERAGEYFRRALDLARARQDDRLLARSLNRLGHRLVNVGRPSDGLEEHRAALEIVNGIGDEHLIAETEDLMGMANGMLGDLQRCIEHYRRAIALFRRLGDDVGLSSALTSAAVYTDGGHTETAARPDLSAPERRMGAEALDVAKRTGSLAALAFAQWAVGFGVGCSGHLGDGFALVIEGLRTADDTNHELWIVGSRFCAAQLLWMMRSPDEALEHLELAYPQARALKSGWWTGNAGSYLALTYAMRGDLDRASAVLAECLPAEGELPQSLPGRRIVWARGEVAMVRGDAARALEAAELLLNTTGDGSLHQRIPRLQLLRGRALDALGRGKDALSALETAKQGAIAGREPCVLWEIHAALGHTHARAGHNDPAQSEFTDARRVIDELAETIRDDARRERFVAAANAALPAPRRMTRRQAAKEAAGGLTEREREVAVRITMGRTNREIADELVLSERTIETHVGNILSKLGFSSRAQVAAWGAERGIRDG